MSFENNYDFVDKNRLEEFKEFEQRKRREKPNILIELKYLDILDNISAEEERKILRTLAQAVKNPDIDISHLTENGRIIFGVMNIDLQKNIYNWIKTSWNNKRPPKPPIDIPTPTNADERDERDEREPPITNDNEREPSLAIKTFVTDMEREREIDRERGLEREPERERGVWGENSDNADNPQNISFEGLDEPLINALNKFFNYIKMAGGSLTDKEIKREIEYIKESLKTNNSKSIVNAINQSIENGSAYIDYSYLNT